MMRFPSAPSAIEWAVEYLQSWRSGRSFDPNPDRWVPLKTRRVGGISSDAADALQVSLEMQRVCIGSGCPLYPSSFNGTGREMCLFLYLFPEPTKPRPTWSEAQAERYSRCLKELESRLQEVDIVE